MTDEHSRLDDVPHMSEFDDIESALDDIIGSSERDDVPVQVTHDIADSVYIIRNAIESIVDELKDITTDLGDVIDIINDAI